MANILLQMLKTCLNKRVCYLHTTFSFNGEEKIMKKIMGSTTKKKRHFTEIPTLPHPESFSKGTNEGKRSINSKRASVLNKLFMRYITDLMATGEYSSEFVGRGIEISRVQVTPDFQGVNVYWIAKGQEMDKGIEQMLQKNAGALRHELSQLKVIGVVPRITFVKDKHYAQLIEVDRLLAKADFGDDYVPVQPITKLKTELRLNTSLEGHIRDQIQQLDRESKCKIDERPLPPMANNVLGLNYNEILARIQKSLKKSQVIHRTNTGTQEEVPSYINENPVIFESTKQQREAFKEFLLKRQLLKSKAKKEDKNYRPELEYLQEEWEHKQNRNEFLDELMEERDYIEEDE